MNSWKNCPFEINRMVIFVGKDKTLTVAYVTESGSTREVEERGWRA
jgi:hypothetical protein